MSPEMSPSVSPQGAQGADFLSLDSIPSPSGDLHLQNQFGRALLAAVNGDFDHASAC